MNEVHVVREKMEYGEKITIEPSVGQDIMVRI